MPRDSLSLSDVTTKCNFPCFKVICFTTKISRSFAGRHHIFYFCEDHVWHRTYPKSVDSFDSFVHCHAFDSLVIACKFHPLLLNSVQLAVGLLLFPRYLEARYQIQHCISSDNLWYLLSVVKSCRLWICIFFIRKDEWPGYPSKIWGKLYSLLIWTKPWNPETWNQFNTGFEIRLKNVRAIARETWQVWLN